MTDGTDTPSQKRLGRPRVYREPRRQMNVMLPEALLNQIDAHLGVHHNAHTHPRRPQTAIQETHTITIINLISRDESTGLITISPQSRRNLNYYTGYVRRQGSTCIERIERIEDGVVGWGATHIVYFDDALGYPLVALATLA